MQARFLLDTHIVLQWLMDAKRLSREQQRVLETAARQAQPVALSAITLLEIAVLTSAGRVRLNTSLKQLFDDLQGNPLFQVLPVSYEIASDVASLGILKDPADRAIVATARIHRLQLVTSDQRIIESTLVRVIA